MYKKIIIEIDYKSEAIFYANNKYGGGLNLKGNKKGKLVLFSKEFFTEKVMIAFYEYTLKNLPKSKSERNDVQGNLSDLGFKRFILLDDCYITTRKSMNDFSTMTEGGICNYWIKGDLIIQYGLNEFKKPPVLIHPLPFNEQLYDDGVHKMVIKYGAKKIIHAIENDYLLDV